MAVIFAEVPDKERISLKKRIGDFISNRIVSPIFYEDRFKKFGCKGRRTIIARFDREELAEDFRWKDEVYHRELYAMYPIKDEDIAIYVDFSLNRAFHKFAEKLGLDHHTVNVPYKYEITHDVAREYYERAEQSRQRRMSQKAIDTVKGDS